MSEQIPSVGRIVHYQSHGSPNGQYKSEPRAAVITYVPDGPPLAQSSVSLCILNPTGMFFSPDVPHDPTGSPGTWRWPPRVQS
jgi:hypothetical protein